MHAGLPLQAVGLIGEDNDGDYITAMLDQYHIVASSYSAPAPPHLDDPVMTDAEGQRTLSLPAPTACLISRLLSRWMRR